MENSTVTEVKTVLVSSLAVWASASLTEKRELLIAKIQAKIDAGGLKWYQALAYQMYITTVKVAGDAALNKIASYITVADDSSTSV